MEEELYTASECLKLGPGYYPAKTIDKTAGTLVSGCHGLLVLADSYAGPSKTRILYLFRDTKLKPKWTIAALRTGSVADMNREGRKFGPRMEVAEVIVSFKFKE